MATLGPLGDLGEMKITGDCEDLNEIPFAWAAFGGDHGLDADVVLADPPNAATNLTNADQGDNSLSPLSTLSSSLLVFFTRCNVTGRHACRQQAPHQVLTCQLVAI